ncbi:MAG: ATP-binding protein [Actinomycetota bacterium]|nr:ATP-binding protein [Actinomycetota bacterium]
MHATFRMPVAGVAFLSRRRAEREAARRALEEERARAADLERMVGAREAVLAALPNGIVLFAPDGLVVYANPAARSLLGRRFDTLDELTPASLREAAQRAASDGSPAEAELETGGLLIQATAVPTGGEGGVVLVARDVTAARLVERVRRDFVANASHELKTPVASILALAETMQDAAAEDPAAMERFAARVEHEARRLSRLVTDLLDLSRLEGGLPDRSPVDLARVVAEEAERLRPRTDGANLRLVVDTEPGVRILGSDSDLGLLVHNLLDNAIQYSPEGGEVRVMVRARDGRAELRVTDTGIGIASRDLDRVFERFYRVDPARSRATGGTGLGLSIVRHVAESHGGTVDVRSVLGAGSTFIVRFPLAPD